MVIDYVTHLQHSLKKKAEAAHKGHECFIIKHICNNDCKSCFDCKAYVDYQRGNHG